MNVITKQGAFENDSVLALNQNFASILSGLGLGPLTAYTADGAISPTAASYRLSKSTGALAMTLAAPVSGAQNYQVTQIGGWQNTGGQDGQCMLIVSSDARAHQITATGLFLTGAAAVNTATFSGTGGGALILMALGGKWLVIASTQITFA